MLIHTASHYQPLDFEYYRWISGCVCVCVCFWCSRKSPSNTFDLSMGVCMQNAFTLPAWWKRSSKALPSIFVRTHMLRIYQRFFSRCFISSSYFCIYICLVRASYIIRSHARTQNLKKAAFVLIICCFCFHFRLGPVFFLPLSLSRSFSVYIVYTVLW